MAVNHHKDISDESKPTLTLMAKNIILYAEFDSPEPTNTNSARSTGGNNRWGTSNIRQWLNSEGKANEWFTPQNEFDTAPSYINKDGFLTGFESGIKQHFATIKNKTILCTVDKNALSQNYEETEDKIFLLSHTEMGFGSLDGSVSEGNHLSKKFPNYNTRVFSYDGTTYKYWLRSPYNYSANYTCYTGTTGRVDFYTSNNTVNCIIIPFLVLC